MECIQLTEENVAACAAQAAEVLQKGGVVLYPTDTLYGLGADALSDEAVAKIYAIKGRGEQKPIHAILSGMDMAGKYAELTAAAYLLEERLPAGQVTFILKKKGGLDTGTTKGIETFGFRIPANEFCIRMVQEFGKPITATSANKSGQQPERVIEHILAQLGEAAGGIDLVIDAGELPARAASTVINLSGDTPEVVREAAISASDVRSALRDDE